MHSLQNEYEQLNYAKQLKERLEAFTRDFLPHMKEEEEVGRSPQILCRTIWCLKRLSRDTKDLDFFFSPQFCFCYCVNLHSGLWCHCSVLTGMWHILEQWIYWQILVKFWFFWKLVIEVHWGVDLFIADTAFEWLRVSQYVSITFWPVVMH